MKSYFCVLTKALDLNSTQLNSRDALKLINIIGFCAINCWVVYHTYQLWITENKISPLWSENSVMRLQFHIFVQHFTASHNTKLSEMHSNSFHKVFVLSRFSHENYNGQFNFFYTTKSNWNKKIPRTFVRTAVYNI